MAYAMCNGVLLRYEHEGPDGAPTIVFSNSLGTDLSLWDGVIQRIRGKARTLRYDKRGHGLSDAPKAPYTVDDHVDDLISLLDHCGIGPAIVCGLSVGGQIAQRLAAREPQRVTGLILCDTGAQIGNDELWNTRIETAQTTGIAAMADAVMERWFTGPFREHEKDTVAGCRNVLTRTSPDGYAGTCAALRDADLTGDARGISVPTLCLVGDSDLATPPELVRALSGLIEGAEFAEIP